MKSVLGYPSPVTIVLEPFCGKSPRMVGPPPCLAFCLSILLLEGVQSSRKTRVYLVRALPIYLISSAHTQLSARARRCKPGNYRNDTKRTGSRLLRSGCSLCSNLGEQVNGLTNLAMLMYTANPAWLGSPRAPPEHWVSKQVWSDRLFQRRF